MVKYKVGAYLRLSKEEFNDEKESNSIINQKQIIYSYLEKHEEFILIDYYIDDGYSGTNFERPEFERMLNDIKANKIDIIIIKDLSRLGRNYIETGNFLEVVLPAMGVSVISVNENCKLDSSSYYSDDYIPLKNLLNDMYAKDISKKVRSALNVKKNNGEFVGKLAPYGYIKDPSDKHKFIIDKNVSKIIIKIFDMILTGKSRREVAEYLNKKEILTPSQYLNINTSNDISEMKMWNPEMVNNILRNENYTGTLFQGKRTKLNYRVNKKIDIDKEDWIVTENHHEAIISKEKFDKVQDILDNYSTRTNRKGNFDSLSGFVICNDCKEKMFLKGGKNKSYYYCKSYLKDKSCTSHSIEKTALESLIMSVLNIEKLSRNYLYDNINSININEDKTICIEYKNKNDGV